MSEYFELISNTSYIKKYNVIYSHIQVRFKNLMNIKKAIVSAN